MRKTIFALMLASAAVSPALAQDHHDHGGGGNGGGGNGGGGHPNGGGGGGGGHPGGGAPQGGGHPGGGAPQGGNPGGGQPQAAPAQAPQGGGRPNFGGGAAGGGQPRQNFQAQRNAAPAQGGFNGQVQAQQHYDAGNRGYQQNRSFDQNRGNFDRNRGDNRGPDGRDNRQGFAGRPGDNHFAGGRSGGGWNAGWRADRRYDWHGYRDQNRGIYHLDRYRAPYGFGGYRRYGIGYQIAPVFFGADYWINDPWYYRLPPAEPPYRWIRYYNDALLIDTYSGTVVDSIPDFFF